MIRIFARAASVAVALTAFAAPAFAHATLEVQEAKIGASYKAVLRVPHGCGTEATNVVRVQIPEGFYNVKPMPKAGWTLETVTGPYEQAYENHGTMLTEGVKEIVWKDGNLPNEWYDEFVFRGTFAGTLKPGKFYFPAIQECASGQEAWVNVTGAADGGEPAPSLELVAAEAAVDEHAGHMMAAPAEVALGDLTITGGFSRATLPNAPVGGGFVTITNKGAIDDRLVAVTSPVAGEVQLHEMAMEGDVMKMRELPDGIPVPAGETVSLQPGGLHMMFMQLTGPLVEGTSFPVTLTFEKAGSVTVELSVASSGAQAPDGMAGMSH